MVSVGWLRRPVLLVLLLFVVGAGAGVVTRASAAQWPIERQFPLLESPGPNNGSPTPGSVAEDGGGELLVLLDWPLVKREEGGLSFWPRTRLVRIAPDGSRAFVPPFGDLEPGSRDTRINVDDEILALPDGSLLFTRYKAIDMLRADGSIVRFAGTGLYGEAASGDGGPATAAGISFAHGLARLQDGSILFGDIEYHRVRQIAPDGTITTVAGSGEYGFSGDGGPATAAQLRFPSDVLPTGDGGFLIADTFNGRVRKVGPDGVISTVAGTGEFGDFDSFGDGGPAAAAGLALPGHLARLPDGTLLIGGGDGIRQISPDGTISTLLELSTVRKNRLGDFVGRYADTIEAMEVTKEGGIAVIANGSQLRALYLAPPKTRRALLAIRDARASERRIKLTVDSTAPGRLRLQIRRRRGVVAVTTRHIGAGRRSIAVDRRFAAAYHDVRVTLRADRGGGYDDRVRLFTSRTLPKRLVGVPPLSNSDQTCKRIDRRRIDCETHNPDDEEDGRTCLNTSAYRLFPSGIVFTRPYGPGCHRKSIPFDRSPEWTGPWRAWPPRGH
jgi:hypothetical protein